MNRERGFSAPRSPASFSLFPPRPLIASLDRHIGKFGVLYRYIRFLYADQRNTRIVQFSWIFFSPFVISPQLSDTLFFFTPVIGQNLANDCDRKCGTVGGIYFLSIAFHFLPSGKAIFFAPFRKCFGIFSILYETRGLGKESNLLLHSPKEKTREKNTYNNHSPFFTHLP